MEDPRTIAQTEWLAARRPIMVAHYGECAKIWLAGGDPVALSEEYAALKDAVAPIDAKYRDDVARLLDFTPRGD